ncbi:hypothetical protein QOZ83_01870 [Romboutsia sedimentorum]|nr:hypothetical protein [Romboutsia sedimentorum]MDK2584593.1 hypothetical protein [Romboutsia sedimentorum]
MLGNVSPAGQGGVDPSVMGLGPVVAVKNALDKANMKLEEMELIELNEIFAVQSLGASGARIITTLLHEMKKRDVHNGLASLCIGGGMGTCVIVKTV